MTEIRREAAPPIKDVWPPPPNGWGGAEGGVRAEQVEVEQERGRLTLRNRRARHLLVFGGCAVLLIALLPLILSLALSASPAPRTFSAHAAWVYLCRRYELLYMSQICCAGLGTQIWLLYDRRLHRGFFVLDKRGGSVRAGGGLFCLMSELEGVLVRRAAGKWLVYLMRGGGDASANWDAFGGLRVPPNACLVADFRQQISAEDVAGIVAEFAGVPVRHQARAKNSV